MQNFDYWHLPGKSIHLSIRPCFTGMMQSNRDYHNDNDFHDMIIEAFPHSGGLITLVTKSGIQAEIEKYFIKAQSAENLQPIEADLALTGRYPIALVDDGYLYTPPSGFELDPNFWIRLNTTFARNAMQISLIPLLPVTTETAFEHDSVGNQDETEPSPTEQLRVESKFEPPKTELISLVRPQVSQAGKLTLKMPTFSPDTDNVREVLDKLERILPMTGHQTQAVIINFIQNSGLDHLLLSLTNDEIDDFQKFKKAMISRYSQDNDATQFYLISQAAGEHELDLLARIQRAWLRLKGDPTFGRSDEGIVSERFITALNDPQIRLKLRESLPEYRKIAEKARQLRLAKEHEENQPGPIKEQLSFLTKEIEKLKLNCKKCGLGHETKDCRANQKMKTQFNKHKNNNYQRNNLRHFETHFPRENRDNRIYTQRLPPAIRSQSRHTNRNYGHQKFVENRNSNNQRGAWRGRGNRGRPYRGRGGFQPSYRNHNSNRFTNTHNMRNYNHQAFITGVEEPEFSETF